MRAGPHTQRTGGGAHKRSAIDRHSSVSLGLLHLAHACCDSAVLRQPICPCAEKDWCRRETDRRIFDYDQTEASPRVTVSASQRLQPCLTRRNLNLFNVGLRPCVVDPLIPAYRAGKLESVASDEMEPDKEKAAHDERGCQERHDYPSLGSSWRWRGCFYRAVLVVEARKSERAEPRQTLPTPGRVRGIRGAAVRTSTPFLSVGSHPLRRPPLALAGQSL